VYAFKVSPTIHKGYNTCMGKALSFEEKLARKTVIDEATGCWIWTGAKDKQGYGIFCTGSGSTKTLKVYRVHRKAYEIHKGELMEGMDICHSCHNKACVNPDHLRQDTHRENIIDTVHTGAGMGVQKLDVEQVMAIKQLLREGQLSRTTIAWMFNVSKSHIQNIANGRRWNWTEDRT